MISRIGAIRDREVLGCMALGNFWGKKLTANAACGNNALAR